MKCHSIKFNLRGYDKVKAIYKLKQSIIKFGDKSGRKSSLLNSLIKKGKISKEFSDLSINNILPSSTKYNNTIKINLKNKQILDNDNDYKKERAVEDEKINKKIIKNLLIEKNLKENEVKNNSFDDNSKQSNKQILVNTLFTLNNNNNKKNDNSFSNFIQNSVRNFYNINKNKTCNKIFNNLLNKAYSPINKKENNLIDKETSINKKILKNNSSNNILYKKILFRNKNKFNQFRNMNLGKKPKININYKILKLSRNSSTGDIIPKNSNIKNRKIFYKKYKKTKDMKLTKIKMSKTQNDIFENTKSESYNKEDNLNKTNGKKNFGQQTINENYPIKRIKFPLLVNINNYRRIPTYIRIPNINRISFPQNSFKSENSSSGVNLDYYDSNYFYLKDLRNKSINKIYMINPFIRNKIISDLKE